jgi:hypothetical protein
MELQSYELTRDACAHGMTVSSSREYRCTQRHGRLTESTGIVGHVGLSSHVRKSPKSDHISLQSGSNCIHFPKDADTVNLG